MTARILLVLALLILPAVGSAQRGGGAGSGAPPIKGVEKVKRGDNASYNVGLSDGSFPITISNKDVESLSPVDVFLDKKKALSLTDEQIKQFKAMETALQTENDSLFRQLDSLRKEMRQNKNASNPQVEQLRIRGARLATGEVIKAIQANYEKAEPGALAVLVDAQQKTGSDLLDTHQKEAEKMLQQKLGGGRRGS